MKNSVFVQVRVGLCAVVSLAACGCPSTFFPGGWPTSFGGGGVDDMLPVGHPRYQLRRALGGIVVEI